MKTAFSEWQSRRARFNHDWLKNQYLPALGRFLNVLDDLVEDGGRAGSDLARLIKEWEEHDEEAPALARDFGPATSFGPAFQRPPLSRCDDQARQWLSELAHGLWLARSKGGAAAEETALRASEAREAFLALRRSLEGVAAPTTIEELRPHREAFAGFRAACHALARAVEGFPDEAPVS